MKNLLIILIIILNFVLIPSIAFTQAQYLIDGANPLGLTVDTGYCTVVTIILDLSNVIDTPLVQAGFWLVYEPTQVSIGEVVPYDWEHGGPWDSGMTFITIPPDPGSGTFWIVVGNFDTVPVEVPIPICDVELCCEGPGQSQITISTIPEFDTVFGGTTVWDPLIVNGIINLTQFAPPCQCVLDGPDFVWVDMVGVVTADYDASPYISDDCDNPPAYVYTTTCGSMTGATIDPETGILTVPPYMGLDESCQVCAMDTANTDINTGEPAECCRDIVVEGGG